MNHLANEKSPYLKQHAANPVDWFPWSEAAFRKARDENKAIFLSVGYSTCHWCHVMERESFENEAVAKVLNESFVSIKVDREERPDVDAIYMDAVQAMTGRGGWPMSVFLTPDRQPFFGGTYFPAAAFVSLLQQINQLWIKDPAKIAASTRELGEWLKAQTREPIGELLSPEIFDRFLQQAVASFDSGLGGRKGAPKFPPSYELRMLLRIHHRRESAAALHLCQTSLDAMGRGGIYDHLGGGFHRYSTDEQWLVPHFEKMLYDQAALASLYLESFQLTSNPEYELITREILDYVLRDLTGPSGGFFSAEDADSEGEEGTFYVWTDPELRAHLSSDEYNEVAQVYGASPAGNFEGKNILHLTAGASRGQRSEVLKAAMQKLKMIRDHRARPHRDEKILCAWNGLMVSAFARAGLALGEPRYIEAARCAVDFVLANHSVNGVLKRRWIDHEAAHDGLLDDYAFLIDALIEVHSATGQADYLKHAERLQRTQNDLFWDPISSGYFYALGADETLIRRNKDAFDNVIPAANSVALLNLVRLHVLLGDIAHRQRAESLLRVSPKELAVVPLAFPQLLMGLDLFLGPTKEVVVESRKAPREFRALLAPFFPRKIFIPRPGSTTEDTTFYICEKGECQLPTHDIRLAAEMLAAKSP